MTTADTIFNTAAERYSLFILLPLWRRAWTYTAGDVISPPAAAFTMRYLLFIAALLLLSR